MRTILLFLTLGFGLLTTQTVWADEDFSHQQIRELVKAKKILSLSQIKNMHPEYFDKRLLDLEVESEHGDILYELELIDESGRVFKVKLNARTGELSEAYNSGTDNSRTEDSLTEDNESGSPAHSNSLADEDEKGVNQ